MGKNILIFGVLLSLILVFGCTSTTREEIVETQDIPEETIIEPIGEVSEDVAVEEGVQVATAKEWFTIAEEESLKWRSDAKLVSVFGNNEMYDSEDVYPADGKTDTWVYHFVSVPIDTKMLITVRSGEIVDIEELEISLSRALYETAPPARDWEVDSDAAVEKIYNDGGGKDYLEIYPDAEILYELTFEGHYGTDSVTWYIGYHPESFGQSLVTKIDATTNEII